jgi:ribosomal protein L34E
MMRNRPLRQQIKTGRSKQRPYGGHLGEATVLG